MNTYSILALDDSPGDLELLRRYLEEIPGWKVDYHPFDTVEEALTALDEWSFDLIFLDHYLGPVTGLAVIKRILTKGVDRPIIVLTGQADHRVAIDIVRSGAADYLVKGDLTPDMLRRAIESALAQYQLRQEKLSLEEDLRQAQKLESIGQLAGGVAHDFNNMLTGIMGYVELAMMKAAGTDIESDLRQVHQTCRSMSELIQQLLALSRRQLRRFEPLDLNTVIRETGALLQHSLAKNIGFSEKKFPVPLMVSGSAGMLQQVLLNLCINAAEAMPDGGTLLVRTGKIAAGSETVPSQLTLEGGEYAVLEVEDTGVGMESAVLERLFDPFFTTKSLTDRKGTGLGLAIVWRNVRDHQGHVTVQSTPGQGTIFRVFLPLVADAAPQPEAPRVRGLPGGSETILVVDDEQIIRGVATQLLEKLGYKTHVAADGAEAVALYQARSGEFDLVLLDISMPVMNGPKCFECLKSIDPGVKVVFSSGHDPASIEAELAPLGSHDFIRKPYSLSQLALAIRRALDGKPSAEAVR